MASQILQHKTTWTVADKVIINLNVHQFWNSLGVLDCNKVGKNKGHEPKTRLRKSISPGQSSKFQYKLLGSARIDSPVTIPSIWGKLQHI